jgi:hypothetical protein
MSANLRDVSYKIFGNEKVAEVVLALHRQSGIATAQMLAKESGIEHPLVRAVAQRLVGSGAVRELPRASRRGALYYEVVDDSPVWSPLVALAQAMEASAAVEDDART